VHVEPGLALGHRRLSIIDLSERGAQPMCNEDGTVWLTFNGEIYNCRQLRERLERAHVFRSTSDSEVLVHLYEDCAGDPARFLDDVRGMFAFAIWDRSRQRLLLARDRLGIKPLVYHRSQSWLAFASDVDALTACPDVPRRIDWTSVEEYLTLLTVPGPATLFRDVQWLPPGSMLVVERGMSREIRYWQLEPASEPVGDASEADRLVEEALAEAVELHLVADVEVGAFLSGGVDSGLVTALATERGGSGLQTFSATFPGESIDEGPWARDAAQRLSARHTEYAVTSGFLDDIDAIVAAMDQPLALPSAVSLFHLSRLARNRVKVAVTGDGGDEVFGGYNRHRPFPAPARAAEWIPSGARPSVGRLGTALLVPPLRARSRALGSAYLLSRALARDEAELYVPRLYCLAPEAARALLPSDAAASVEPDRYVDRVRRIFGRVRRADPLSRLLHVDLETSLVDEMLTKTDRMGMAWGLELRVPMLDHRVVESGMRIAGRLKRKGDVGKLPLRRLVGGRLGPDTASRGKHGFSPPLARWLRADAATRGRFERLWDTALGASVLDAGALRAMRGRFDAGDDSVGRGLFAALVLALWAEQRGVHA